MTKLRCVPVDWARYNLQYGISIDDAPPPPKEIAEALELAERHMRLSEDPPADCKICTLSRALLQSWGRE